MASKTQRFNGDLSTVNKASPVRTLDFAQRYTTAIDFSELDKARFLLERTNAFADPNEADANGVRLMMPTPELLNDMTR